MTPPPLTPTARPRPNRPRSSLRKPQSPRLSPLQSRNRLPSPRSPRPTPNRLLKPLSVQVDPQGAAAPWPIARMDVDYGDGAKDTGMKAFGSRMTEHEIWDVVNYIRTLKQ